MGGGNGGWVVEGTGVGKVLKRVGGLSLYTLIRSSGSERQCCGVASDGAEGTSCGGRSRLVCLFGG